MDCDRVIESVRIMVKRLYGFEVSRLRQLPGFADKNFHVTVSECISNRRRDEESLDIRLPRENTSSGHEYVLKIMNARESRTPKYFDAQDCMMMNLKSAGFSCSYPVENKNGRYMSLEDVHFLFEGSKVSCLRIVRLLVFIPGTLMADVRLTPQLLYDTGRFAGKLRESVKELVHEGFLNNLSDFNMERAHVAIENNLHHVKDVKLRTLIAATAKEYLENVARNDQLVLKGVIHGDLHCQNLILKLATETEDANDDVTNNVTGSLHTSALLKTFGIIDFGDSLISLRVFEISNCISEFLKHCSDWSMTGYHLLSGYLSESQLTSAELQVLPLCIRARLAQIIAMSAAELTATPDTNEYVSDVLESSAKVFLTMSKITPEYMLKKWTNT